MIVDFHTHTFPEKIAEKTISYLSKKGGFPAFHAGTNDSLKDSMKQCGIDYCVVLPIATAPKQETSINRLSAKLNGKDRLFFAGAIHPDCEDVAGTLDFIKESGLFGVKLHPDYQGTDFDDPRYLRIMEEAAKRDLFVITHAGIDLAFRDHVHCTPDMVLHVLAELKGVIDDHLILAHLGGFAMPDEVLEKLIGTPVYMDTAAVLHLYPEKCRKIIAQHGPDRILFATDSPWEDQKDFVDRFFALGFEKPEEDAMLFGNAERILGVRLL